MKSNLNQELSSYLKLLRFKSKVSQEEISKRLGVTRQTYSNWERKPIKLDLEDLVKIGDAIGEDVLIFFDSYVAERNTR